MLSVFWKDKKALFALAIFIGFTVWWHFLNYGHQENTNHILDWFAGTYGVLALVGGLIGLKISSRWGGFRSVMGRAIIMFSFGLLAQEFGQLAYAYYAIVQNQPIPYPSVGDIGFFGSIPFYIYGSVLLAKASGVHVSMRSAGNKLLALLIPAALLGGSYYIFLRDYPVDWSQPVATILDFGYPLGQAIYISITILAFLLSRRLLGGLMRPKLILVLVALCAQYAADFNFLIQIKRETWTTAAYGDYLYAFSYLLMAVAIINVGRAYTQIKEQSDE